MNFVFLMDPLDTVKIEKDTSFILMLSAQRKGHKVFFVTDGGITLKNGKLSFQTIPVVPQQVKERPFIKKSEKTLTEKDIDIVFVRSDPPFDYSYLMNTWLLDRLPEHIPVINTAHGLRSANEKVWATQFTTLIPPTLVGRNQKGLLAFLNQQKDIVAKPTDGFGGQNVFHLKKGDSNVNVILETLTQRFSRDIILQKFIPESEKGDKRILLLDGEPLGAVLRVHADNDYRNNFFAGGKPYPTEIDERDQKIIKILKPKLQELGLYFVGLDIMGGYLIEVNVTSPTCLQEMNRLYHRQLENKVIEFAEKLVEQYRLRVP